MDWIFIIMPDSLSSLFQICLPVVLRGLSQNNPSFCSGHCRSQKATAAFWVAAATTEVRACTGRASWQETALLSLPPSAHRRTGFLCGGHRAVHQHTACQGRNVAWGDSEQVGRDSKASLKLDSSVIPCWGHAAGRRKQMGLLGSCSQLVTHYTIFALSCLSLQLFNQFPRIAYLQ